MKNIKPRQKPRQIKALLALAKASFLSTLRNPTFLFFNFFFPFIFIIIFGSLNYENITFSIGVREESIKEGYLYDAIGEIKSLKLVTDKSNPEIDDELKKGRMPLAINIQKNEQVPGVENLYQLTVESSAADPNNAQMVEQILDQVVTSINNPDGNGEIRPVTVSKEIVEGRKFKQIDFILPGQLAFALLTNALFGIPFVLLSLKTELVIKRIFAAPVKNWVILGGEVISKTFMALLQTLVIVLVGHFVFKFTLVDGAFTVIYVTLLAFVGIFCFLSLGLFVASIAKNEDTVSPIANLIMMPQLFLSGAFFAIEAFPKFIQPIARILPMTLLNDSVKLVAFEGAPFIDVLPKLGGIMIWGIVIYLVDMKLFKWE